MKKTKTNANAKMRYNRRTRKHRGIQSCKIQSPTSPTKKTIIVENFIEMLNNVKLYHWNTHSFSQHKATDELHERLSEHVDKFVEILLGKKESRIKQTNAKIHLINCHNTKSFKDRVYQYREYLIRMDNCFDPKRDTDLLNVRDEILGDINQLLYLLTLDK